MWRGAFEIWKKGGEIIMTNIQKITPFLWFEKGAEDAAEYYVSVFKNSMIHSIQKYPKSAEEVSGQKAGSVMSVELELNGIRFQFLNGGKISEFDLRSSAVSFVITCETQEEVDHFWQKLSAVPEREQCGWCVDKFGVTWQVVPKILSEYLSDPDTTNVERVTACFLQMKKFDIAELKKEYEG
jgi:predicted 3-demethylubiquinone-9 3-methyltransferase (glyoxalase superfamily)